MEKLIKMLKEKGIKSKEIKNILHAFMILENVAFDLNIQVEEFFAMYKINKLA